MKNLLLFLCTVVTMLIVWFGYSAFTTHVYIIPIMCPVWIMGIWLIYFIEKPDSIA